MKYLFLTISLLISLSTFSNTRDYFRTNIIGNYSTNDCTGISYIENYQGRVQIELIEESILINLKDTSHTGHLGTIISSTIEDTQFKGSMDQGFLLKDKIKRSTLKLMPDGRITYSKENQEGIINICFLTPLD